MESINPEINALHAVFCQVTGRDTLLIPPVERWWMTALQYGITADMIRDVMQSRIKSQYSTDTMRKHCLSLRHCIGDDDRLAQFVDEAAQIAATKRKRVFVPGKAQVLRDTGRPDEPEQLPARSAKDVIRGLKEAAQ